VMGAEIRVKVAPAGDPPPADPGELTFLAVDPGHEYASRAGTRTPYTTDFDGADAGKTAHYMLHWVNSRGETGPWSKTASATVGA